MLPRWVGRVWPPGRYFRLLLLGYFEGLDSERGIAWRAADSLSIRIFLDFALHEAPPDHSTLSRTRRLIDLETHEAVFTWVLQQLADANLVQGYTIGIDATTLEANAAMRSIVRRDTGEPYDAFLTRLAEASGIATPTRAELARFDRTRKKKGSNDDWTNPHDPDAKITKMKDGRTHLAHTAEHAVDLETGAIVGVTVQDASAGDTTTMVETLITAAEQVEAVGAAGITEVVGDKGYHSNETMEAFVDLGVRSYVSEPDRGRSNWEGKAVARKAVYARAARGQLCTGLLMRQLRARPGGCWGLLSHSWAPKPRDPSDASARKAVCRCRRAPAGCESSSHSGRPRATAVAAARRAPGTAQRPSLRDRRDAPRPSSNSLIRFSMSPRAQ